MPHLGVVGPGCEQGADASATLISAADAQVELLRDLCDTMLQGSLCAMGGMTPFPVLSALNHFPEDFGISQQAAEKEIA